MSIKRRLDALTKRLSEDLALCPTCGRPVNLEVWSGVLMVEEPPARCPGCHHPVDTQGKPILVSIIMVMPGMNEGPSLDELFFKAKGRWLVEAPHAHDSVCDAALVLQGDEHHAGSHAEALATEHEAGDGQALAPRAADADGVCDEAEGRHSVAVP